MSTSPVESISEPGLSLPHFREFLNLLELVEQRTRRVRAVFRTAGGAKVAEFTVRNQSVEPGVIIEGSVFRDDHLQHDTAWLAKVLAKLEDPRLTSAQLSRRLVRSTKRRENAEDELRGLTARALLQLARIGAETPLEIEFDKSGAKRGPVFSFPAIELLAAACQDYAAGKPSQAGADAMTTFADAVWNFRPSDRIPGFEFVPVSGTQGASSVSETLALAANARGLLELARRFDVDSADGSPKCFHHLADDGSMAWIAVGTEVTIGRFDGPRSRAALGPSKQLVPPEFWI